MLPRDTERKRLIQITDSAREIATHLSDILAAQTLPIHFRPSSDGVTLVGLDLTCPQLGRGGYDAQRLRARYQEAFEAHCTTPPGRDTPEKRLQSFLIRDAYQHGRRMAALMSAAGDDPTADIRFITDELALVTAGGDKLVCDLLAVRLPDGDPARATPVLIELKSARHMTRLVEQLTRFAGELHLYHKEFSQIASALLGMEVAFAREPELWMVWRAAGKHLMPDPREEELGAQGIRVVQYVHDGDGADHGYRFHVGRRPVVSTT